MHLLPPAFRTRRSVESILNSHEQINNLFPRTVLSIKCWVCNSATDKTCADPFNNYTSPIIDCKDIRLPYGDPEAPFLSNACRTTRYLSADAAADPEGEWQVVRDCGYFDEPCDGAGDQYHCELLHLDNGARVTYDMCIEYDGCNSGSSLSVGLVLVIGSALLAVIAC